VDTFSNLLIIYCLFPRTSVFIFSYLHSYSLLPDLSFSTLLVTLNDFLKSFGRKPMQLLNNPLGYMHWNERAIFTWEISKLHVFLVVEIKPPVFFG